MKKWIIILIIVLLLAGIGVFIGYKILTDPCKDYKGESKDHCYYQIGVYNVDKDDGRDYCAKIANPAIKQGCYTEIDESENLILESERLWREGKHEESLEILESADIQNKEDLFKVYMMRGRNYESQGNFSEAIKYYKLASDLPDPMIVYGSREFSLQALGSAYEKQGTFDKEVGELSEYLSKNPKDEKTILTLFVFHYRVRTTITKAAIYCEKLSEIYPEDTNLSFMLADIYFVSEEYSKAAYVYEKLEGQVSNKDALDSCYSRLISCYLIMGNKDKVIEYSKKQYGDGYEAWYFIGNAFRNYGMYPESIEASNKAIDLARTPLEKEKAQRLLEAAEKKLATS